MHKMCMGSGDKSDADRSRSSIKNVQGAAFSKRAQRPVSTYVDLQEHSLSWIARKSYAGARVTFCQTHAIGLVLKGGKQYQLRLEIAS